MFLSKEITVCEVTSQRKSNNLSEGCGSLVVVAVSFSPLSVKLSSRDSHVPTDNKR